jgi:uncharacterized membrane protein YbhN (UPF0104 family)
MSGDDGFAASGLATRVGSRRGGRAGRTLRLLGLLVIGGLAFQMRERLVEALVVLRGADPALLAAGFVLYLGGLVGTALRASLWLRGWRLQGPPIALLGDVLASTLLNAVTVSGAGELYRVQAIVGRGAGAMDAAFAVFADRVLGLGVFAGAALLGLAWTGAAWLGLAFSWTIVLPFLLGGLAVASGALALMPTHRGRLLEGLRRRRLPRATLAAIGGLALGTLSCWVLSVACLARALGLEVPFDVLVATAPLVAVAAFLPITIGGIGVREAGYSLLLAPVGVTASGAIALGLAQYACFLIAALLGGGVLLARTVGGSRERLVTTAAGRAGGSGPRTVDP